MQKNSQIAFQQLAQKKGSNINAEKITTDIKISLHNYQVCGSLRR